jgi:hypothetical protein
MHGPAASPKPAPSLARLTVLALAGYALAVAGGCGAVWLAELARDPRVADASSGMYAFGDLLQFLLVTGLLSLAPTWLVIRGVRSSLRAQGLLGAALLAWAAGGPTALLGFIVSGRFADRPAHTMTPWAALVSGLSVLRLAICLPSFLLAALGRLGCTTPQARRHGSWAIRLEALTCLAVGAWFLHALR